MIGVLKDSRVGDTLREVAVTVTEVGVRGYKLVEDGAEKVYDTATGIYKDAARRADEAESDNLADDLAADTAATAESVASEAEQFLREQRRRRPVRDRGHRRHRRSGRPELTTQEVRWPLAAGAPSVGR